MVCRRPTWLKTTVAAADLDGWGPILSECGDKHFERMQDPTLRLAARRSEMIIQR